MSQYSELVNEAKAQFQQELANITPEIQANWKGLCKISHTHDTLQTTFVIDFMYYDYMIKRVFVRVNWLNSGVLLVGLSKLMHTCIVVQELCISDQGQTNPQPT